MTVVANPRTAPGRHRQPDSPVPVIPGNYDKNPPQTEFPRFVPATPPRPEFDIVAKRVQMNTLLQQANAGEGIRREVEGLLNKIAVNPNDKLARGELNALQYRLGLTAQENQAFAANPQPLTGAARKMAENILHDRLAYPGWSDAAETTDVLRQALSVGEVAAEATIEQPVQTAEITQTVSAGRHAQ